MDPDSIALELAREIFGTDDPDDDQVAAAKTTTAFALRNFNAAVRSWASSVLGELRRIFPAA